MSRLEKRWLIILLLLIVLIGGSFGIYEIISEFGKVQLIERK